jgi:hypothetical protein
MTEQRVIKVLIQTLDGRYVARAGDAWGLTSDFSKAEIFDYPDPGLGAQLKEMPSATHSNFVVVPFDALKTHETCDRCGRKVRPSKTFFDGAHFLCPECKTAPPGSGQPVPIVMREQPPGPIR